MKHNSRDRFTKFANEYTAGGFAIPSRVLTKTEQQIIIIHSLLNDGQWHTAQEIADRIGVSRRTTHNIMLALITPLGIASGQHGYTIPNKNTVLIA